MDRRPGCQFRQVGVEVRLELVEENLELAVDRRPALFGMSAGSTITAPCCCISAIAAVDQRIGRRTVAEILLPRDADPRSFQAVRLERPCGSRRHLPALAAVARSRGSTPAIAPSRTAASATVRAIGPAVSWVCEIGMIPDRLDQANGRLDPDQRRGAGRTDDRTVGLGADRRWPRDWRRPRRRCPSSSRTGCDRATYGFLHLAAASAPSARGFRRAEVRPLAQVRLAENHSARIA